LAACATTDPTDDSVGGGEGKADGPSTTPSAWSREVVADNAQLWNGGPVAWGAGTSIALRANGQPIIAYYDSSYRCNNGGFGTYSPDSLIVARGSAQGWKRAIEACGPEWGYWPRLRVDDADRTHVLFGGGWYTNTQRAYYVRWDATDHRQAAKFVDSSYMSSGALALTIDDAGTPLLFSNGKLIKDDGTTQRVFDDSSSQAFVERDNEGTLHVVASTLIPEPNDPNTSISRLRYARLDASGTTIESPRTAPLAVPLGFAIDSDGQPHVLSWNTAMPGQGELWHSTRTQAGWVEERIASDVPRSAALAIGADDELFVVAPGKLFRHAASATSWTATNVSALASASYPSLVVAPDGVLHVAFEVVGPIMSNRVSRAAVYHATFHP
jgi:hypothetical protein